MEIHRRLFKNDKHFNQHAWKMLTDIEATIMRCEIKLFIVEIYLRREIEITSLVKLLNATVGKARKRGRDELAEQRAKHLAESLLGGAGTAHKMANADNLLLPLRLVIRSENEEGETHYINDPLEVTKHYAAPWKKQWNDNDPTFASRLDKNFQRLRRK